MNFYDALEIIMKREKLTQVEVNARIGKSVQYISNARARGSVPKVDTAAKLLNAANYRIFAVPSNADVPSEALELTADTDEDKDARLKARARKLEEQARRLREQIKE